MSNITVKEVVAAHARNPVHPAKSPIGIFVAAIAWIFWVFQSYLPSMFPVRSLDFWLRRTGAYDVFLVLWFAAVPPFKYSISEPHSADHLYGNRNGTKFSLVIR